MKLDDPKKKRTFDITTRGTFSIWAKARSYRNKGNKETRVAARIRDHVRQGRQQLAPAEVRHP